MFKIFCCIIVILVLVYILSYLFPDASGVVALLGKIVALIILVIGLISYIGNSEYKNLVKTDTNVSVSSNDLGD